MEFQMSFGNISLSYFKLESAFKPKCDTKKYPFGCCWDGRPKVSFNEKCPREYTIEYNRYF